MQQITPESIPNYERVSLIFEEEIASYLIHKYWEKLAYMKMIFELRWVLKPLPEWARVSINIPVSGHQEFVYIYNALFSYSEQGKHLDEYAGWNTFEINLFVNVPEPTPTNPHNWDDTLYEIERFQNQFPHIHINVLKSQLPTDFLDIGIIRGIVTDVHLLRPWVHPDHIVISHDADQISLHPLYIKKMIEIFENPNMQIFWGKTTEDPISQLNHPDLFVRERFWQFLSKNHFNTPGANSAYRASAYVQVGGYQPVNGKCWEDTDLGQRIIEKSCNHISQGYYGGNGRVLRVVTSGRRNVGLIMEHGKILGRHAWEQVHPDGTRSPVNFSADDFYRCIQVYPNASKLSSLIHDDIFWTDFLKTIAPHIFQKIYFQRQSFSRIEDGIQKEYGTDENRRKEISKAFWNIQVLEYSDKKREEMNLCSSVVDFPLCDFPRNARRALYYLWVEEIDCKVGFCSNSPMSVFVDIQITRADTMRAGLQKFLDKMKATYRI